MLFNSLEFLIFGTVFFALWPSMKRGNLRRWVYITCASIFFYSWWDWRYTLLLIATGLVDFFAGRYMVKTPRWRKWLLFGSISANIGSLAFFKYTDFAITNINCLFHSNVSLMHMVLPVGISFYTFQSMSYTIDIYRGRLEPTPHLLHFFTSLTLFPHLVAGPIMRASELQPQLVGTPESTPLQRWDGLRLTASGFFKKVVIADNLAPVVNKAFSVSAQHGGTTYWWCIMVMFSYQIYCDFSGYSDIARGLAKWMGYEFTTNFDHPYISASASEFWRRWHMSLSTWFRDYVYIPLGGSRAGAWAGYRNLWITMLLSGLWHGAAWTFIIWAALHSLYLTVERITDWPKHLARLPGGRTLSQIIIFLLVAITWVFFRAESLEQGVTITRHLLDLRHFTWHLPLGALDKNALALLAVIMLRQVWVAWREPLKKWRPLATALDFGEPAALVALILACVYLRGPGSAFIYFQF